MRINMIFVIIIIIVTIIINDVDHPDEPAYFKEDGPIRHFLQMVKIIRMGRLFPKRTAW